MTMGGLKFPKEPPPPGGKPWVYALAAALAILVLGLVCLGYEPPGR